MDLYAQYTEESLFFCFRDNLIFPYKMQNRAHIRNLNGILNDKNYIRETYRQKHKRMETVILCGVSFNICIKN